MVPLQFPFYGEGARPPPLLPNVNTPLQARCGLNRSAHAPPRRAFNVHNGGVR
jgi:hypothetical protein